MIKIYSIVYGNTYDNTTISNETGSLEIQNRRNYIFKYYIISNKKMFLLDLNFITDFKNH